MVLEASATAAAGDARAGVMREFGCCWKAGCRACCDSGQGADDAIAAGAPVSYLRVGQQALVAADDSKRNAGEVVAGPRVAYDHGEGGGGVDVSGLIEYGADGRLESGRCTGARGLGEEEEEGGEDDVAAGAGARGRVPLPHQESE
jgi:hypothetical protein